MKRLDALAWVFMFLVSALWIEKQEVGAFLFAILATTIYLSIFIIGPNDKKEDIETKRSSTSLGYLDKYPGYKAYQKGEFKADAVPGEAAKDLR